MLSILFVNIKAPVCMVWPLLHIKMKGLITSIIQKTGIKFLCWYLWYIITIDAVKLCNMLIAKFFENKVWLRLLVVANRLRPWVNVCTCSDLNINALLCRNNNYVTFIVLLSYFQLNTQHWHMLHTLTYSHAYLPYSFNFSGVFHT